MLIAKFASNGMRILSISTDRNIFNQESAVRARVLRQAREVEKMFVIVFALKSFGFEKIIDGNLEVYPTNSLSRLTYLFGAIWVGLFLKDIDLITTQDPFETGLVGLKLKFFKRAKLQLQIHTDFLNPFFSSQSPLNRARVFISRFVIARADRIRVVSLRIKKSLDENFKNHPPVDILPVYAGLNLFSENDSSLNLSKKYLNFDFFILSISRLEKEKNLEMMFNVFKKIVEKRPKTALIVVGDGSMRKSLEEKAKMLKLDKNVKFEGWQRGLVHYYRSANVLLSTSNYEGYGLTFIEAANFLCPIVSSDVGIMGEVFQEGKEALICPVGDEKCFEDNIRKIQDDPELGKRLSDGAFSAVHKNIIPAEEYFKKMSQIWKDCLL